MPTQKPAPQPPTGANRPHPIRVFGPAIPLAIALIHSAVSPAPPQVSPSCPPAPATVTTTAEITTTSATPTSPALPGCGGGTPDSPACQAPLPMLSKGHPVNWWFVFKLNSARFPQCGGGDTRSCPFGGSVEKYKDAFGQQFLYASSEAPTIQNGSKDCLGTSTTDPVGATFNEVYNGNFHYVVWNDQPYNDPILQGCSVKGCKAPWGHSKGMLAWNDAGEGFVMQVSTPSWPMSGSARFPRKTDGNTLGCTKDNNVEVSQHFFALKLNKSDVTTVLNALINARVATDPKNPQITNNGGPSDIQALVSKLGTKSPTEALFTSQLSSGVRLISKPSSLNVPPWQMVSSVLGGVALRTATWWADPKIYSTTATTNISCWSPTLPKPGPVEIATTGHWNTTTFDLTGGPGTDSNHAKLGVTTSGTDHLAIFGDMNQQGSLAGTCDSSQNGRGGLFFVVNNPQLSTSLTNLLTGESAPTK